MDISAVARELFEWAQTPAGAFVLYPTAFTFGVAIGLAGGYMKKKCSRPDDTSFDQKLPKSEP